MVLIHDVVDLSHHNGDMQFHALAAAGVMAVFLKASEGVSMRDDRFAGYVSQAREAGLRVGAYHFLDNDAPIRQLDNFSGALAGHGALRIALDYERATGTPSASALDGTVAGCLSRWRRHPMVYGSDLLAQQPPSTKQAADCELWLAHYGDSSLQVPAPWRTWRLLQYTDRGTIAGAAGAEALDLSAFNGPRSSFAEWWDSGLVTVS